VDENALIEALNSRRIYGAGLDVFWKEPLPKKHPLTQLDNVVLSPHRGAATVEANLLGLSIATDNIENWIKGRPTNLVA
ncbi:MAG TPA: NAD(P)-dependent oxidoreductase, partial [Candidatus Bathyarchaeia archaeon]|nr:NAD(P)-dependent oxidoreductase [Candidatus Bathyarchaeia archaeon]